MLDFDFVDRRKESTVVDTTRKVARNAYSTRGGTSLLAPGTSALPLNEGRRFLRIVAQTSRIKNHDELFQLLQGEEIQYFIPHQVMICAWGDFSEPDLKLDVISAIPGAHSGLLNRCGIDGLLQDLYQRWFVHGRQPLLLDGSMDAKLACSCDCALHGYLQEVTSLLVHGVIDARNGSYSLYLALNAGSSVNGHNIERFRLLTDPLFAQIDVAFRGIGGLKSPELPANQRFPSSLGVLSAREDEIVGWITEGKTNAEIAAILAISPFTVKNHVHRIFVKLDATNRSEAVAKYLQMGLRPQRKKPGKKLHVVK